MHTHYAITSYVYHITYDSYDAIGRSEKKTQRRFTPQLEDLDLAHTLVVGDVKVFDTGSNWRIWRDWSHKKMLVD